MDTPGKLIVLEGADEAALDGLAERLARWLHRAGLAVECTRQPTNGPAGAPVQLYRLGRLALDGRSAALCWVADCLDHQEKEGGLRALLDSGRHVLCLHYDLLAYATLFDLVDWTWHRQIRARCPAPDLTLYLDAPAAAPGAPPARYRLAAAALAREGAPLVHIAGGGDLVELEARCRQAIVAYVELETNAVE